MIEILEDGGDRQPTLQQAVQAIRDEPIPPGMAERVARDAILLPARQASPSRRWRLGPLLFPIAAGLAGVALFLRIASPDALAKVVAAVESRPWFHAAGDGPDGPVEVWYSKRQGVLALKFGAMTRFADYTRGTVENVGGRGRDPNVVYVQPLDRTRDEVPRRAFESILLGNLGEALRSDGLKVVEQTHRTILDSGRQVEERRFVSRHDGASSRFEVVFLVDSTTDLPFRWRVSGDGLPTYDLQVSYPDDGPAALSALGVADELRRVDLTPREDLAKIMAMLRAGRRSADAYRAVVSESTSADLRDGALLVRQVRRSGTKRRVDLVRLSSSGGLGVIPDEETADAWWLRRAAEVSPLPRSIQEGATEWTFTAIPLEPKRPDPANPDFLWIDRLERRRFVYPSEDDGPRDETDVIPELVAYPKLDQAVEPGWTTTVESMPNNGPAGTVLVESRRDGDPQRGVRRIRRWHDPDRGWIAVRSEFSFGEESSEQVVEILDAVPSPSGIWFPKLVRTVDGAVDDSGPRDLYMRFVYDFEDRTPDDVFNAEAVELSRPLDR